MSHAFFVPRGRHPFAASPLRGAHAPASEVAGALPVGLDVFSSGERVGRPRPGDVVVIGAVGAYNLIAANEWAGEMPEIVEMREKTGAEGRGAGGRRTF
jgi:diaminopimelate decarboxylase